MQSDLQSYQYDTLEEWFHKEPKSNSGEILVVGDYKALEVVILADFGIRLWGDDQLAKMIEPGMQEEQQVKEAEELISQAIDKINRFFATDWLAFRKQVEQTPVKIFKEYKPI